MPFGGTGNGARDDFAKFHDKLKALGRGFGVGNTGFDIIAKTNEVRIMGADSFSARAKPTRDGALLVSGRFKINASIYGIDGMLPETRIERVKSTDPEK